MDLSGGLGENPNKLDSSRMYKSLTGKALELRAGISELTECQRCVPKDGEHVGNSIQK